MTQQPPEIKIRFIGSSDAARKKHKRLTSTEAGIVPRLEHLYPFKALIEDLFGNPAFMKIKMGASMKEWRDACLRLLSAIELSVTSTVEVADRDWFKQIYETIQHGRNRVRAARRIDDLFGGLSATLAAIVFIQLGNFPLRAHARHKTTPLVPGWWTFTGFRTVQYVQNDKQREAQVYLNKSRAERARKVAQEEGGKPD